MAAVDAISESSIVTESTSSLDSTGFYKAYDRAPLSFLNSHKIIESKIKTNVPLHPIPIDYNKKESTGWTDVQQNHQMQQQNYPTGFQQSTAQFKEAFPNCFLGKGEDYYALQNQNNTVNGGIPYITEAQGGLTSFREMNVGNQNTEYNFPEQTRVGNLEAIRIPQNTLAVSQRSPTHILNKHNNFPNPYDLSNFFHKVSAKPQEKMHQNVTYIDPKERSASQRLNSTRILDYERLSPHRMAQTPYEVNDNRQKNLRHSSPTIEQKTLLNFSSQEYMDQERETIAQSNKLLMYNQPIIHLDAQQSRLNLDNNSSHPRHIHNNTLQDKIYPPVTNFQTVARTQSSTLLSTNNPGQQQMHTTNLHPTKYQLPHIDSVQAISPDDRLLYNTHRRENMGANVSLPKSDLPDKQHSYSIQRLNNLLMSNANQSTVADTTVRASVVSMGFDHDLSSLKYNLRSERMSKATTDPNFLFLPPSGRRIQSIVNRRTLLKKRFRNCRC